MGRPRKEPEAEAGNEAQEQPTAEETPADEPAGEATPEPAADETPAAEESPAEEPQPAEPEAADDEPAPAAEEPAADEPAPPEPVAEEPAAPEPVAEEAPAVEEPAAEVVTEEVETEEPLGEAAPTPEAPAEQPKKKKRLPRSARRRRTKPTRESAGRRPLVRLPKPEGERGRRKERRGVVVSRAMDKTIVVRVDTVKPHRVYKKIVRRSRKFHAHDETNAAKTGDVVRIVETRPLSKTKTWRLAEVLEEAK
jgi:small subunit ribosomal protein S17